MSAETTVKNAEEPAIAPNLSSLSYNWPHLDGAVRQALLEQSERSLSDQTAKGIIGEAEEGFRQFLGAEHCVAFSSGTAALHAMVRIADLRPGDEMLVGAYGFFASASPFAYEGIRIRFVDVDRYGNIDLEKAKQAISSKTKAVMCVHMWGNPCDMPGFRALCDERSLWLFEDCAHAHFAKVGGRRVGLWGDIASFSFNQKALTAGEGGFLVCSKKEWRERALLFGHYNKRSLAEVSPENPDSKYSLTGYGLKYRPHTLAMALALTQIKRADDIEKRRLANLQVFEEKLRNISSVSVLTPNDEGSQLGLYVLPLSVSAVAPGGYREALVARMTKRGAWLLDIPDSTRQMTNLPLFDRGEAAFPEGDYPGAVRFARSIIKLPLWGYPGDEEAVHGYASALVEEL